MKRILFLVLLLVVFTMPCAFAVNMTVYENNDYHFKFSHPYNWEIQSFTRATSVVIATHPSAKWNEVPIPLIEVDIKDSSIKNIDEAFSSQSVNTLIKDIQDDPLGKKFRIYTTVDDYFFTNIKNKKALFIKTITTSPGLDGKVYGEQYIIFHRSYRYAISTAGTADDLNNNRQILNDILNSFEFL